MNATETARRTPRTNPVRQRAHPHAAMRVLLALALALTMVPATLVASGPDASAAARQGATSPARYPSLTDYLSRAQDESLVGKAGEAADERPQQGQEPLAPAAGGSERQEGEPGAAEDAPGAEEAASAEAPAAPETEAAGTGAGAPEGESPASDGDEGQADADAPDGRTEAPAPETDDADAGAAPSGNVAATDSETEGALVPENTDDGATSFPGNVLELFSGAFFAESEGEDGSDDDGGYEATGHDLYLKYLLADSDLVSEGDTIDDVFTSEDKIIETVIAQYSATADLLDPGSQSDYYIALMDTTRLLGNAHALDAAFALPDNLGHVVEGPVFDRETGIAYVPKSLYEDGDMAIVAQVLLSYDLSANPNVMVDVHVDNGNARVDAVPSQSVGVNALDVTTTLPVASPATAGRISMRDLTVRINGSESPFVLKDGRNAAYDRTTGELTIFYSPMNLFSVEIEIAGPGIVDDIVQAASNEADAVSDTDALATFPGVCFDRLDVENLKEGDWFQYEAATNYVWPNPKPGDVSKDVRDFCVPYCYGYANDPESLYDVLRTTSASWDQVGSVDLVASSGYFNCVIGTPDEVISGQDWRTDTWPATSSWSQGANGWWSHIALECGHVSNPIGTAPTTAPYAAPVGMRILRVNLTADEPYIVVGFIGSMVATQSGSGIYKFRVKSQPKFGGLIVEKRDNQRKTLTAQGDASLDPTTFDIFYEGEGSVTIGGVEYGTGERVMQLTTQGGVAKTAADALQEGEYSIKETSTGEGYRLSDTASRRFTVTGDKTTCLQGDSGFHNDVARGGLRVEKRDAESRRPDPQGDASLDGTTFEVTNRSACPVRVNGTTYWPGEVCSELVIENGKAATAPDALPYGTYEVRETAAGTGYLVTDAAPRTFQIRGDGEVVSFAVDDAFFDEVIRGGVSIEKRDAESRLLTPLGGAALDGTVFEITNESEHPVLVDGAWADPGSVCLSLTAKDGVAASARDALPYGTYSVREVLPGEGYLLSDPDARTFSIRIQGQAYRYEKEGAFYDQVKRGDISFVKVGEDDMARLAGVPFRLTSQTTGESHVLVTDANGRVDTSAGWIPHTRDTNANDAAADDAGNVDASKLNPDAGTWFGRTTEGWTVEVDDGKCALPYDTYTLEELRCPANEGLELVVVKDITVKRDLVKVDMGTIDDKGSVDASPVISTFASDSSDLDRTVNADDFASVVDRVECSNLALGATYTLRSSIVDGDTGEPVDGASAETAFTADAASKVVSATIEANLLSHGGTRVVVFEELVRDGAVVAEHKDPADTGQTVIVSGPRIKTFARDAADDDGSVAADGKNAIVDTVSYANLTPGAAYVLEGALMVKAYDEETGDAFAVPLRDDAGNEVTRRLEFTPDDTTGEAEVRFDVDTALLEDGTQLVAYETLKKTDRVIAMHQDMNDKDQTVVVGKVGLSTSAADGMDGDKVVFADAACRIVDTVSFEGLVAGASYAIEGSLMVKAADGSASPLLRADGSAVTSSRELVPLHDKGQADVEFVFDSRGLEDGCELVVFERLVRDGETVCSHEDASDAAQTLSFAAPRIVTDASDADDGDKTVSGQKASSVTDDVKLENVVPGKSYSVLGIVMDPATGLPACPAHGAPTLDASGPGEDGDAGLAGGGEMLPHASEGAGPSASVEEFWRVLSGMLGICSDAPDEGAYATFSTTPQSVSAKEVFAYVESSRDALAGTAIETMSVTPTQPEHSFSMGYELDSSTLAGDLVVCDVLMADDGVAATHLDLASAFQTFSVSMPELSTVAYDKRDGDHEIGPLETAEIVDRVTYSGLVAGKEYVMRGTLMDKSAASAFMANDKAVECELRFTPNSPDGAVDMAFSFDASAVAENTELVVFEQLFKDDEFVAEHADFSDAAQTITVTASDKEGPWSLRDAGDDLADLLAPLALAGGSGALVVAVCGILGWRRSRLEDEANHLMRR